jgi:metal-responsive CopG/Arc/MetJ family transcriptional regulator
MLSNLQFSVEALMTDEVFRRHRRVSRVRQAKNATFSLPIQLLQEMDVAVQQGASPSKNALVERAIRRELAEIRRLARRALLEEAKRDPLFLRDLSDVERDFAEADAETAREIV